MKKLLWSVVLLLVLACVFVSCEGRQVEHGSQGENDESTVPENPQGLAFYLKDDGTYGVGIGTAELLSRIEIPSTYQGKTVNEIVPYGFGRQEGYESIKEIVLPSTIEKIGKGAFYGCRNLEKIDLSDSVTSIGDYAFCGCDSLTSIELPEGVMSIGEWAFNGCDSLMSIEIPSSVTSIGVCAFLYCGDLTSVTFGENSQLTSIDDAVFKECDSLTSVIFGLNSQLTSIGESAFYGCTGLTSITIPASVTSIGTNSFSGCYKLVQITNLSSQMLENLPSNPGQEIRTSTSETFKNTFASDENGVITYTVEKTVYLFEYTGSELDLSSYENIIAIYPRAFYGSENLTRITIPSRVTSIGADAFYGCNSLTSAIFENPNGWGFGGGWNVQSEILSDPARAAEGLTSAHYDTWTRK